MWRLACLLVVNATLAHAGEPAIPSVMDRRWSASMGYGVGEPGSGARSFVLGGAVNLVVHYHWGGSQRVRRFVP